MRAGAAFGVAIVSAVLAAADVAAEDPDRTEMIIRGKSLYDDRCRDCHGRTGGRKALGRSKRLDGLDTEDLVATLRAYRLPRTLRGMKDKMKSGLGDDDILSLAAYIERFGSE